MANVSRPAGLSPIFTYPADPWQGGGQVYCIPQTDGNAYAVGDPVIIAGDADANGVPTITLATAGTGNPVLGPIISPAGAAAYGTNYGIQAADPVVIPASKTRPYYVLVADDPSTVFEVEEDGASGATIAAASVGLNVNLVSGTNNGYVSGWKIQSSSVTTTATLQCKLLRAAQRRDNALGVACKWWVLINNHPFRGGVAGI